jgi:DNA-binding NtrC family response regulator
MTRVLIVHHDKDVADIEGDELRRAGYEVDQCAGPIGGTPCPVLHGERCWQVELADVLIYDVWASGDGASALIDDLRDLHPDKPVVLTSPGPMLNWAEIRGHHRVTPVPWASGVGLPDAIENALKTGADQRQSDQDRQSATKAPQQPGPGPHW